MNHMNNMQDCKFDELELHFQEIASADQVPIAKLALYATASMKHLVKYEALFQKFNDGRVVWVGSGTNEESWYSRVVDLFTATLEQARHTGTIRAVDSRRIGRMFLDAILNLMMQRIGSTSEGSIEDDVRALMDLYLNGLAITH